MIRQMLEPGVFSGYVPVLHFGGNGDDGARSQLLRFLAPFLIPAATSDTDQYLYLLVVDVPIVAAARLEGYVVYTTAYIGQIAVANEILSIARVGLALRLRAVQ